MPKAYNVDTVSPSVRVRRTARLLMRVPELADLDFVADLFAKPDLVAHRPHPAPDTREQSAARLTRDITHWQTHGFGRWAIEHDGIPVGFGGLTVKDDKPSLNLSYHLYPDAWGKGFASEMVAEALRVAFDELRATKVVGLVRPINVASRRVLERAGFEVEETIELDGAPTVKMVRTPDTR
jgi:RimJ/RimL family protein N-acetyltransferase